MGKSAADAGASVFSWLLPLPIFVLCAALRPEFPEAADAVLVAGIPALVVWWVCMLGDLWSRD